MGCTRVSYSTMPSQFSRAWIRPARRGRRVDGRIVGTCLGGGKGGGDGEGVERKVSEEGASCFTYTYLISIVVARRSTIYIRRIGIEAG